MKFRQISILLGVLILGGSVYLLISAMGDGEESKNKPSQKGGQAVKVKTVELDSVPAIIPVSGELEAEKRIDIFAEVQGRFEQSSKPFKEGIAYQKGEVLIQIDNRETRLNLQAQKSNLMNSIAQMLPDLKLDYPDHYERWKDYLENLQVEEPLDPLPVINEEQVKYFVTNRNIFNQYYSIQSQEERLSKYTIRAPFDGVVTASRIDPGTLVRPGQQLGQFINTDRFEMGAAIGSRELNMVNKGDRVELRSEEVAIEAEGKVKRVNERVNPGTQFAEVFITISHEELKEGMFLQGEIYTGYVQKAFRLPRKFLEDNQKVWVVEDDKLKTKRVEVAHKTKDIAIVKGLAPGTKILFESVPTAYSGMPVKPVEDTDFL